MEKMYGSIHTHVEDSFDAVTNMKVTIKSFLKRHAVKVATTSHGTFIEYENIQDVLSEAKSWAKEVTEALSQKLNLDDCFIEDENNPDRILYKKEIDNKKLESKVEDYISNNYIFGHAYLSSNLSEEDIDILLGVLARIKSLSLVPGVEAYFENESKHMVLIAKNEKGYEKLSKIISESNASIKNGKPIVTFENLERNVKNSDTKDIVCTSACIGGLFAQPIMQFARREEKIEEAREKLRKSNSFGSLNIDDLDLSEYGENLEELVENQKRFDAFVQEEIERIKLDDTIPEDEKEALLNIEKPNLTAEELEEKIKKDTDEFLLLGAFGLEQKYITEPLAIRNSIPKITKKAVDEARKIHKKSGLEEDYLYYMELIEGRQAWENEDYRVKVLEKEYKSKDIRINGNKIDINKILKENRRSKTNFDKLKDENEGLTFKDYCDLEMLKNVEYYNRFVSIFGRENLYLEIQNHGSELEEKCYKEVVKLAKRVNAEDKLICSNDIHLCVTGEDAEELSLEIDRRNIAALGRFDNDEYRSYDDAYEYREVTNDEKEYYIKSDEMLKNAILQLDKDKELINENIANIAVNNIKSVLSDCNVVISKENKHYPLFCLNEDEEFDRLVEEGINRIFPNGLPEGYRERLDYEKGIIKSLGYSGYHLIVQDYIAYGKLLGYLPNEYIEDAPLDLKELEKYVDNLVLEGKIEKIGMGIGPGRGSAAGSLCCFALGITDIDPIKYNLLFERFLNTERVSMPDIDTDFKTNIRSKTYEYCKAKYGVDNVSKIMTKTYLALKGAIKMGSRYALAKELYENRIVEGSDEEKELKELYKKAGDELSKSADSFLLSSTEYQALNSLVIMCEKDYIEGNDFAKIKNIVLKYAGTVLGMFTVTGQHAAGVIISKDPIKNIVPVMWNDKKSSYQIQCEMARAEEYGLLKMDFLGLNNLDIITEIAKNPTNPKDKLDIFQSQEGIQKVFLDKNIYKNIFSKGRTHGVFQFESPGMKDLLKRFKPESFEDIVLLVALYRPGPMDFIDEIVEQKWFRTDKDKWEKDYNTLKDKAEPRRSITVRNKVLDDILKSTYGCPVYQEQIMEIFQKMAGYSLGGADIVRRYMSKKAEEKLAYEKKAFVYGDEKRGILGCCKKHGLSVEEAEGLFEQMMPFAKYGFNRSHAACYAAIACYTAYLKEYRLKDFYRVSMDAMDNVDSLESYYKEAENEYNIVINPPSIDSKNGFTVLENGELLRGFSSVKGMGNIPPIEVKTDCAEEFIISNPMIPIKNIVTMAELGLFKTTWKAETAEEKSKFENYINNNLEAIGDFVDENGKDLRDSKPGGVIETRLREKREAFRNVIKTAKPNEKIASLHKRKHKDKSYLLGDFAVYTGTAKEEQKEKILAYMLRHGDSLANKKTIENEYKAYNENNFGEQSDNNFKTAKIPCIVLKCKDGKTRKGKPMQYVTIMDLDGRIQDCRYYEEKMLSEGDVRYFVLPKEENLKFAGVKHYQTNGRFSAKNIEKSTVEIMKELEESRVPKTEDNKTLSDLKFKLTNMELEDKEYELEM